MKEVQNVCRDHSSRHYVLSASRDIALILSLSNIDYISLSIYQPRVGRCTYIIISRLHCAIKYAERVIIQYYN